MAYNNINFGEFREIEEEKMKYQIIVDSCSDLDKNYLDGTGIGFKIVPLTINVGDSEYVDEEGIEIEQMLEKLKVPKIKSGSACPAPESFKREFGNADYTFVVTITSKLSGCYNAAVVAKNEHENSKNIHIIDSKAVSGTEILIVDKLVELIKSGMAFEKIVEEIEKYRDECTLFFVLQRFDNLVNNGRMSKIAGLIASTISLKPICKAVDGEIKIIKKIIGVKTLFHKLALMIKEVLKGDKKRKIVISHCYAKDEADELKTHIENECENKNIKIIPMKGLTSYYALEKGVIVCF